VSVHFVVCEFNGVETYAVEFYYLETRPDGGRRFPQPKAAFPITEGVARLPLRTLIKTYKRHKDHATPFLLEMG